MQSEVLSALNLLCLVAAELYVGRMELVVIIHFYGIVIVVKIMDTVRSLQLGL